MRREKSIVFIVFEESETRWRMKFKALSSVRLVDDRG